MFFCLLYFAPFADKCRARDPPNLIFACEILDFAGRNSEEAQTPKLKTPGPLQIDAPRREL